MDSQWSMPVKKPDGSWTAVSGDQCLNWLKESQFCNLYDRIATDPDRIEILDLALPAFLDAVPNFRQLRAELEPEGQHKELLANMSACLQEIPKDIELWDWHDSNAHERLTNLYRTCNMTSYKAARFTKMLHLKRPALIPILDAYVLRAWRERRGGWTSEELAEITLRIRDELSEPDRMKALEALKEGAEGLGEPWAGLSKLRLFDIVSYWHTKSLQSA